MARRPSAPGHNAAPLSQSRQRSRSPRPRRDTPDYEGHTRGVIHAIAGGFPASRTEPGRKRNRENEELFQIWQSFKNAPPLQFSTEDLPRDPPRDNEPLVISGILAEYEVRRIFVDQGSSADILFWSCFQKLGLAEKDLVPYQGKLIGFTGDSISPRGYIDLKVTLGAKPHYKTVNVKFLVVDCPSAYNVILGRPSLNLLGAVISTLHMAMKFYDRKGLVITVRGNKNEARSCYLESLKVEGVRTRSETQNKARAQDVMMVNLDPRGDFEHQRPQPEGDQLPVQIGAEDFNIVKIGTKLPEELKERMTELLRKYVDVFAWSASDMPGVNPDFCCHRLSITPGCKPVAQKKRNMGRERQEAATEQTRSLLEIGFIREIRYATWLANVVMVKKTNGKWRMCTDYTDLNRVCPKDPFPLPSIDRLVDSSAGYKYLSFLDAYSGYNQIPMHPEDEEKTAFITDMGIFCYKVMTFGLKNVGATYQRLMGQVFKDQIGRNLEVYIDDMIVKTPGEKDPVNDLREIFEQLRRYNLKLNPAKCTFGVEAGKFLGYMLTNRGIEANPEKCQAVIEMRSPACLKEAQQLAGRLAALARFLPTSAKKSLPLFRALKRTEKFSWTEECEKAFSEIKDILAHPPVLSKPEIGEDLYLYLAVSEVAVSAVLVKEVDGSQKPIYFVSKVLQESESKYQRLEKLAYALVIASRKLRPYFHSHHIIVRTAQPMRQILHKPDLAGRMMAWAIELSQYDITYEPRHAIKAQALADFLLEMTPSGPPTNNEWIIYVDGSSNSKGSGAGIILENPEGVSIEHSLKFDFPTSNNQAEYEACLAGLRMAKELGATAVIICSDSQLVVSQIKGDYQAREPVLQKYLAIFRDNLVGLSKFEIRHIPREENSRADLLSKLASTKGPSNSRSIIEAVVSTPSAVLQIEPEDWRTPIMRYISKGILPEGQSEAKALIRKASKFTVIEEKLFRKGVSMPLLKCISPSQVWYVLAEIHEGCCGHHPGGKSLARKALRAGYFWPTMQEDAKEHVRKCEKCQTHAPLLHNPPEELHSISAPWPFHTWGMDILGPFPLAPGQLKFLVVAVDYFTKWVETEPLSTITAARIQSFAFKHIICRFGIPAEIITDNGTQFTDKNFRSFLEDLRIKQRFASVEHPQTNGQAEAANKVILSGLKRRLDAAKGSWADQLYHVLWSYRTTPHSTTGETPYKLTYGSDAVIPVEIGEPSWRVMYPATENDSLIRQNLDLIDEEREYARLKEISRKQQISLRYNERVNLRVFDTGDLVLRRASIGSKNSKEGKLAANWEGPYRITRTTRSGGYALETLRGEAIKRTFNAADLKRYFS